LNRTTIRSARGAADQHNVSHPRPGVERSVTRGKVAEIYQSPRSGRLRILVSWVS